MAPDAASSGRVAPPRPPARRRRAGPRCASPMRSPADAPPLPYADRSRHCRRDGPAPPRDDPSPLPPRLAPPRPVPGTAPPRAAKLDPRPRAARAAAPDPDAERQARAATTFRAWPGIWELPAFSKGLLKLPLLRSGVEANNPD
ncbi:hypothetical protein EJB05_06274, partial [Eragrostis curvula]